MTAEKVAGVPHKPTPGWKWSGDGLVTDDESQHTILTTGVDEESDTSAFYQVDEEGLLTPFDYNSLHAKLLADAPKLLEERNSLQGRIAALLTRGATLTPDGVVRIHNGDMSVNYGVDGSVTVSVGAQTVLVADSRSVAVPGPKDSKLRKQRDALVEATRPLIELVIELVANPHTVTEHDRASVLGAARAAIEHATIDS